MKVIKNGRIVTPDAVLENKILVFDKTVVSIEDEANLINYGECEVIDAENMLVCPGLIDMHIHGYLGDDVSDGDEDGLKRMSENLIKNGVTAFLPTTMTVSYPEIEKAFESVRNVMKKGTDGAVILGVNAEGPFISSKMKGAQAEENIKKPDADFLLKYKDIVRITTLAPESEGAVNFIEKVKKNSDIIVSIGHCDADFDTTVKAFDAGVSHVTHLFNAMSPMHHRILTCSNAALSDDRVYCEIIADTFHISPHLYNIVYRAKEGKIILITDCTRAGGMPEGEYTLGGQKIVLKGIECRLSDGTVAGSVLKLNKALKNFKDNTNLKINEVVNLATLNPAGELKDTSRGSLAIGKSADIVIFDDDFNTGKVFIAGELKYGQIL